MTAKMQRGATIFKLQRTLEPDACSQYSVSTPTPTPPAPLSSPMPMIEGLLPPAIGFRFE